MCQETEKKQLVIQLFIKEFGNIPEAHKISGGGSSRMYFRLKAGERSVVGVVGDDKKENKDYINLSFCLGNCGINIPQIICISHDNRCYLLQDLGDDTLFRLLDSSDKMCLAFKSLEELIKLQMLPEDKWIDKVGNPPFSSRLVKWDLNYFKYDFLKPFGILYDEEKLEDDFDRLTKEITSSGIIQGFMYRDFQSRNIMVKENKLWFIDFQGARKGPVTYDAVSFIWQAKAPFTFEEREDLGNFYIDKLTSLGYKKRVIAKEFEMMRIFRSLQVLGAYGFRGLIEKKAHFLESLPQGIMNLTYLRRQGLLSEYPELTNISKRLEEKQNLAFIIGDGKLTLSIFSFSYKRGYPQDYTGNGGGFMFDCRALHNPGRYDEYKNLTGRDELVKEFLESTPETSDFLNSIIDIVRPSVEVYLKRGFTSLQIGFGCTGGQHRSVYCAENFAKKIKKLYPEIKVKLIHREQGLEFNL